MTDQEIIEYYDSNWNIKLAELACMTGRSVKELKKILMQPEEGKQYLLIGGKGQKSIANGNTWKESEINGN